MSEQHGARWLSRAIGVGGSGLEVEASRRLLSLAMIAIKAQEASLLIWDPDINELRFVATVGNERSEAALLGHRVPLGKGITGLAAVTRGIQIGAPTFTDFHQTKRAAQQTEPEAIIAAPVVLAERLLGVITGVSFETGRRFGKEEAAAFGEYAAVMAAVLEQGRRLSATAAIETGIGGADTGIAAIEREIVERLARIVGNHPDVLGTVARLFEAIETLIHTHGTRHHRAPPHPHPNQHRQS